MKKISIEDKDFFTALFHANKREHNEFNFTTVFCWDEGTQYRWFEVDEWVILCSLTHNALLMPLSKKDAREMSMDDFKKIVRRGLELGFSGKTLLINRDWHLAHQHEFCPEITLEDDRANYDYIYKTTDLSHLAGRNYAKKRNLISQFEKSYTNWHAAKMQIGDESLCLDLAERWCKSKDCSDPSIKAEMTALKNCLAHRSQLSIEGTLLFLGTTPIAFSLWGLQHHDMATIHFEKADFDFKGVGQMINRETARHIELEGVSWINREQDLGDEGLRQAKMSYFPARMIEVSKLILPAKQC